ERSADRKVESEDRHRFHAGESSVRTLEPNRRDDPVSVQASGEKADRLGGREQANSRGTQALGGEPKRKQRRKDADAQIEQGGTDERRSDAPRQPHAPGGRTRCW